MSRQAEIRASGPGLGERMEPMEQLVLDSLERIESKLEKLGERVSKMEGITSMLIRIAASFGAAFALVLGWFFKGKS